MHTMRKWFAACAAALLFFAGGLANAAVRNVSVGNWTDLKNAVQNASSGDVLCVTASNALTMDYSASAITIDKALTIMNTNTGVPITVSRVSVCGASAFVVTASGVTINGFKFVGTDPTNAVRYEGCIRSTTGTLTVKNCTFEHWKSYYVDSISDESRGGAVTANGTKLVLEGCTFKECTIDNKATTIGRKVDCAGAVSSYCTDTIVKNCSFIGNSAYDSVSTSGPWFVTGALCAPGNNDGGHLMVAESTFVDNALSALYTWIKTDIFNSTFLNNAGPAFTLRATADDQIVHVLNSVLLGNNGNGYDFLAYQSSRDSQIHIGHSVYGACSTANVRDTIVLVGKPSNLTQWFLNVSSGVPQPFVTKVNGVDRYAYPLSEYAYAENRNVSIPLQYDGRYADPTVYTGLTPQDRTCLWYGDDTTGSPTLHTTGVDGLDCYDASEEEYHFSCGSAMSAPIAFDFVPSDGIPGGTTVPKTAMWNYGTLVTPANRTVPEGYTVKGWLYVRDGGSWSAGTSYTMKQLQEVYAADGNIYFDIANEFCENARINTYTIEYRGFKAPFDSTYHRVSNVYYRYGSNASPPLTLSDCPNVEAFDYGNRGYAAYGWATSQAHAQAGTVDYDFGQVIGSSNDGGVDLTTTDGATVPLWIVRTPYTGTNILFSGNTDYVEVPATTGVDYTLPECTFTPPQGYKFGGWLKNGVGTPVPAGTVVPVVVTAPGATALVYEALWTPIAKAVVDGETLWFVYDTEDYGTKGEDWFDVADAEAQAPNVQPPWYGVRGNVTKVVFDASFGVYKPVHCGRWFDGFSKLTTFEGIKNLDVSAAWSMASMFCNCLELTTLDLAQFDTANVTDMGGMFFYCPKLTTIYASDKFVTAQVTSSSAMFDGCSHLVGGNGTVYLDSRTDKTYARIDATGTPGYFTEKTAKAVVQNGGKTLRFVFDSADYGTKGTDWYAVADAEALSPATDPAWNNTTAKGNVTLVVFDPSFKDYCVKHCGSWFWGFTKLTTVSGVQNLDTSRATSLAYMFGNCSALTSLSLDGMDTSKVTAMNSMFSGCTVLETIYASDSFVTEQVTSSANMFANCTSLVGGMGTVFNPNQTGKTYAHIDGGTSAPGYFTEAPVAKVVVEDGGATLRFVYDKEDYGVEGTDWYAVADAEAKSPNVQPPWYGVRGNVTKVVFDASFRVYKPMHCGRWFDGFSNLTTFEGIKNLDVSAAWSMDDMFCNCLELTTLDLTWFDTANVTDMGGMFFYCPKLTTIYASDKFVTAQVTSSGAMFDGCSHLVGGNGTTYLDSRTDKTYARIDGGQATPGYFTEKTAKAVVMDSGKTLKFVFDGVNYGTKDVNWYSVAEAETIDAQHEGVKWESCGGSVTKVVFDSSFKDYCPMQCGSWFYRFGSLATVEGIENLDTSEATSLAWMFSGCSSLTSLDLSGFDTAKATDMRYMFSNSDKLVTIYATPSFETDAVTNSVGMFNGCTSLVGGVGTEFDAHYTDKTGACIDTEVEWGYFSAVPAVVVENGGLVLRFVCDGADYGEEGVDWYSVLKASSLAPSTDPAWKVYRTVVTNVIFDASFKYYRPKHCGSWFYAFSQLKSVEGLGNLDTSEATSFAWMFSDCYNLTSLDLSGFRTPGLTDTRSMFSNCSKLTTIYATGGFSVGGVTLPANMFNGCSQLVGYNGTTYDSTKVDTTYARIDKANQPGYFTPVAQVVVEDDGATLRFVFDGGDHGVRDVDWYSVAEAEALPTDEAVAWGKHSETVTKVVFDASFRNYRPKNCNGWFYNFFSLSAVVNMANLDVSEATSLYAMFGNCTSLASVDLMAFDTANVTNFRGMFYGCSALETICASALFDTESAEISSDMFTGCTSLVGGEGSVFDATKTDATYARIDGGALAPGYFTEIATAKVVVEDNGATLRFVYDKEDYGAEGTDWFSVARAEAQDPWDMTPWYGLNASITKVVFDDSFADYRPKHCGSWFYGFLYLTQIADIRNLDTSEATDMEQMFANCIGLQSLDLSRFDTSNVKGMSYMFANCLSLTTIYASDKFVTGNVVSDWGMFQACNVLVGYHGTAYSDYKSDRKTYARTDKTDRPGYFTDLSAKVVVEDGGATLRFVFNSAEYLGTWYSVADAEDQDPSSFPAWCDQGGTVTKVVFDASFAGYRPKHCGMWFYEFTYLATIEGLENLDTSAATSTVHMFNGCTALTTLDVSGFDTSKAVTMRRMFGSCASLTTIYASDKFVTAQASSVDDDMFSGCLKLVGGKGTAYDAQMISKDYARLDGGTAAPGYFTAIPKAVVENGGKTLRFVCDGGDYGVKGTDWFSVAEAEAQDPWDDPAWYSKSSVVTNVIIDATFADYRPKHCGSWFYSFTLLKSIEGLGNLDVSDATSMMYMFCNCSSLTSLDLSGFRTPNLTDVRHMFKGCTSLQAIYATDGFTTASVTQDANMFLTCTSLVGGNGTRFNAQKVNKEYARIDGGTAAPGYFTGTAEAKVVVENGGKTLRFVCDAYNYGVKDTDWYSVAEAEAQDPWDNPAWYANHDTVTNVIFDASFAGYQPKHCGSWFYSFVGLTTIEGIENLDTSAATSMAYMFYACPLTTLDLTDFVTSNVTDMINMFSYCTSLKTIYASEAFVTTLVEDASDMFYGCTSLVGGKGTGYDAGQTDETYARLDGGPNSQTPGYFADKNAPASGFEAWAAEKGLTGADAAWDAKPAMWNGWANAFVYTFGEGLADGSIAIMNISFDAVGQPVITTTPVIEGRVEFMPAVIGTTALGDWSTPVTLDRNGNDWTLPAGEEANFFKVSLTK